MSQRVARIIGPDRPWVIAQSLLFTAFIVAPVIERRLRHRERTLHPDSRIAATIAVVSITAGTGVAFTAKRDLRRSFTMSPTPLGDAELVTTGVYSVVRHPMYLSVLLVAAGYAAAWRSRTAAMGWIAMVMYLVAKMRWEERALAVRYRRYHDYCQETPWRCVPGVF